MNDFEKQLKDILNQLASKANNSQLDDLMRMIENLKDAMKDLEKLKERVDAIEKKLSQLEKMLGRRHVDDPSNISTTINQTTNFNIDEREWEDLKNQFGKLRGDMDSVIKEVQSLDQLKKRILKLENAMDGKLDREEFEKWKAENDWNKILNGLVKKFADRNEMLRALKKLEARILALEELMREGGTSDTAENALLAKKPLGGWSCASC